MASSVNKTPEMMSNKLAQVKQRLVDVQVTTYYVLAVGVVLLLLLLAMAAKALQDAPAAHIEVSPDHLSNAQFHVLKQAMAMPPTGNFFTTDLQELRDLALSQPWVDQVSISRDWQRGIVVSALPKQAVANFGTERLIDAKGSVFVPVESTDLMRTQFATLQGDQSQSRVIMQQMQQINEWFSPLNMKVEDIILTPRMTWLVRFDNGIRVIVDNENTAQKLLSLSQLLNNQLATKLDEIQSVDLRYKNGFTVAWRSIDSSPKPKPSNDKDDVAIKFEGKTDQTIA